MISFIIELIYRISQYFADLGHGYVGNIFDMGYDFAATSVLFNLFFIMFFIELYRLLKWFIIKLFSLIIPKLKREVKK